VFHLFLSIDCKQNLPSVLLTVLNLDCLPENADTVRQLFQTLIDLFIYNFEIVI